MLIKLLLELSDAVVELASRRRYALCGSQTAGVSSALRGAAGRPVSMSPERKLSDADQFEIVVRLSSSGAAMAQPGDWQWLSAPQSLMGGGSINLEAKLQAP